MTRVQFSYPPRRVSITKNMPTPMTSDPLQWFKQARRVIPEIPSLKGDWQIWDIQTSQHTVLFELRDSLGNKCAVVIERSQQTQTSRKIA